jgi:hypothetical protein
VAEGREVTSSKILPAVAAILFKKGDVRFEYNKIKVLRWLLKSKHVKIYKRRL